MRIALVVVSAAVCASAAFAEKQPFERYQSIIDRQMFGRTPEGFNPDVPPELAPKGGAERQEELTREQEVLKSAVHFSAINVTPEGETAVGFTDNSDPKVPVHYYLKVGETRDGWKVVEADPLKATMKIVRNDVEVSLELGANSAKGGGTTGRVGAAEPRAGAIGPNGRRGALPGESLRLGSLRERRAAREQERLAQEAREKAEREEREKERQESKAMLENIAATLRAQREEKEAKEREAAERQSATPPQSESNAENDD